ncbi:hypothetical protein BDV93DRAFT_217085 [Ceratobasidium sp. AG-I]|nr:hypothetical protein BDV93DRAFT_217085 [Ceratobasidium sp. AG-I]
MKREAERKAKEEEKAKKEEEKKQRALAERLEREAKVRAEKEAKERGGGGEEGEGGRESEEGTRGGGEGEVGERAKGGSCCKGCCCCSYARPRKAGSRHAWSFTDDTQKGPCQSCDSTNTFILLYCTCGYSCANTCPPAPAAIYASASPGQGCTDTDPDATQTITRVVTRAATSTSSHPEPDRANAARIRVPATSTAVDARHSVLPGICSAFATPHWPAARQLASARRRPSWTHPTFHARTTSAVPWNGVHSTSTPRRARSSPRRATRPAADAGDVPHQREPYPARVLGVSARAIGIIREPDCPARVGARACTSRLHDGHTQSDRTTYRAWSDWSSWPARRLVSAALAVAPETPAWVQGPCCG